LEGFFGGGGREGVGRNHLIIFFVNIIFFKAERFSHYQGKYASRDHLWSFTIKEKEGFIISLRLLPFAS